jgi:hypothetical protein
MTPAAAVDIPMWFTQQVDHFRADVRKQERVPQYTLEIVQLTSHPPSFPAVHAAVSHLPATVLPGRPLLGGSRLSHILRDGWRG